MWKEAAITERDPVHRHCLPDSGPALAAREGAGLFLYRANSDIRNPGVHKPHWEPW